MAAVSASTILLLTEPMLRLPENIWAIAGLDATLIVEATGTATVAMTITGTGIGTGIVTTVIVLLAATTGTVVIGTRMGAGVAEGAPVAIPLIVGEEVTPAALVGPAQFVPVNVTVINSKSWW